jgi:UDP-2,4-diacetamido-2,4,6-trideoxy-beta-L-altropyranose hydrolase
MLKKSLLIRTDANAAIGMGHLVRCVSLARMLESEFSVSFLLTNTPADAVARIIGDDYETLFLHHDDGKPTRVSEMAIGKGAHALVLDGYEFDYDYQRAVRNTAYRTVYIDDLLASRYCVDLLINQADNVLPEQYAVDGNAKLLLGPAYALLRPEFLEIARAPAREIGEVRRVFVNFGGVDLGNITRNVLKTLPQAYPFDEINVLIGQFNSSGEALMEACHAQGNLFFHVNQSALQIKALLAKSDLAIVPNSSISLEACTVSVPMITGITADNQLGYSRAFHQSGLSIDVGDWRQFSPEVLAKAVRSMLEMAPEARQAQLENQKKYIDGFSGRRILSSIQSL